MTGHEFDVIAAFAVPAVLIGAGIRAWFLPDPEDSSNVNRESLPPLVPEPEPETPDLPKRVPGAIYQQVNAEFARYRVWAA